MEVKAVESLVSEVVSSDDKEAEYSHGRVQDLQQHLKMIEKEFVGQSRILLFHAEKIIRIRRKIDTEKNFDEFDFIWHSATEFLLESLDSRWLVSACDTIADHHPDGHERTVAASAALFANTIKLYETERWATKAGDIVQRPTVDARVALHDGMSAFVIGTGDMIQNLIRRLMLNTGNSISSQILKELVRRVHTHDTVFNRFLDEHVSKTTDWRHLVEN